MARLIYEADYNNEDIIDWDDGCSNREASVIVFEIPDDLTIDEFNVICKRMASAMGYHPNSINRVFIDS